MVVKELPATMTFDETLGRSRMRDPVIKLHGAEAFAAMHKAGRLTAQGLDMLGDYVKPGVTTQRLDDLAFQFAMDNGAYPATLNLSRLHQVDLHLDQPCRLPRHPRRQALARGRHRQHRLHPDRRWLARRFQPDVWRRRHSPQGRAADRDHL
jgi:hypothetical protein